MRLGCTVVTAIVAALFVPATAAGAVGSRHDDRPCQSTIDLPEGFAGEGVAVGAGNTFYAGSLADGRIARGDLRAGTSEVFIADPVVAPAVGLKADVRHRLLWVAGGPTGTAAVYDLDTGSSVAVFTLSTVPSFINDVVVTRYAAYFTNSLTPVIYRVPVAEDGGVGEPVPIELQGPAGEFVEGFNINGIEATHDGGTLILVNTTKGELYTVDPSTGDDAPIDIGGVSVPTGDGLLLVGRMLLVLQNGAQPDIPNQIVVIRLRRHLTEGQVVHRIESPLFETATTLARRGGSLVVVNAQFDPPTVDPEAEVVLLNFFGCRRSPTL